MTEQDKGYPLGRQIGRIEAGVDALMKAHDEERKENRESHRRIEIKVDKLDNRIGDLETKMSALEQWKEDYIMFQNLSPRTRSIIIIGGGTGVVSLVMFLIQTFFH